MADASWQSALSQSETELRKALLEWFDTHRRDLPWRRNRDPYAIWISEIMLQQTRVDTVVTYFERWMQRFPTLASLAQASEAEVFGMWSGLGYYRRAANLHRAAQHLVVEQRTMPRSRAQLIALPGIGAYTAGAIASIAFDEVCAAVDGNVERVLSRLAGYQEDVRTPAGRNWLWRRAEALVDPERPGDFNQALMELGATVCTPTRTGDSNPAKTDASTGPACGRCPWRDACVGRRDGQVSQLPRIAKRVKSRAIQVEAWVLCWGEGEQRKFLFARTKKSGLWAGQWGPILSDPALTGEECARPHLSGRWQERGHIRHVLTHRNMTVQIWTLQVRATNRGNADVAQMVTHLAQTDIYDAAGWFQPDAADSNRAAVKPARTAGLSQLGVKVLQAISDL